MSHCQLCNDEVSCPVPMSEDRLMECFHNAERLEREYHDPRAFRYNLNALLASVNSVEALLQKEIEKKGDVVEWNRVRESFKSDPWLGAVRGARNVTLHQKAIFDGSKIDVGLYRGRRLKLAFSDEVRIDLHSAEILERWTKSKAGGMFLDPGHSALNEQYGVWRKYWIKEISDSEDVLVVIRRALIRVHDLIAVAHGLYGVNVDPVPSEYPLSPEGLARVTVLLESDIDPALPKKWGWE